MSNKFGFAVFSVPGCSKRRAEIANSSRGYLSSRYEDIGAETILIASKSDFDQAVKEHWQLAFLKFKRSGNLWLWGQIGIISSTYLACQKLLKSDLDGLVVVEDDIILADGFSEAITENIAKITDPWDVFFQFRTDIDPNRQEAIEFKQFIGTLGAYVISRSGAQKIMNDCVRGIRDPLDLQYCNSASRFARWSVGAGREMHCKLDEEASDQSTITKTEELPDA